MILASLQRGVAAGILSAVFVFGTGPAAQAQAQKPTGQKSTQPAAKTKPSAKTAPAASKPAKPTAGAKPAAAKPAAAAAAPATGPGGASLLASFGDWGVYTAQSGRSKICYALSQPKDRLPKNLNRDPAYLFVSFRPAENVKNEVAVVFGFAAKENGPATVSVGSASYALLTKDTNAWLKNPAEESQAIATMARGQSMLVKAQSARGNSLTDQYSLSGFNAAIDRARKECQ